MVKTDVLLPGEEPVAAKPKLEIVKPPKSHSPFAKAANAEKRTKLFLWGDSGVGKTTLALSFPSPVVIDLEGGTDLYGGTFNFERIKTTSPDEIMAAVDWLASNEHTYRTLVIDPMTIYWESLQRKWSEIFFVRNKKSAGYKHEFYDLQPKDWQTIKAELKELIRKLMMLDMTVIVTAREKTKYKEGSMMVAIGETFDGEKSLPYMFDVIIRMSVGSKGEHIGKCMKDRSNNFPKGEFDCSYDTISTFCGADNLGRPARRVYASEEQQDTMLRYITELGISKDKMLVRLAAYDADSLDMLTMIDATSIIEKLQVALEAKKANTGGNNNANN